MTQEFHLSITSLGSDRYLIRTEDAAAGVPVAETQVDWPVEEWLQLAQPAMGDPLLGVLQGTTDLSDRTAGLPKIGTKLYDALFQNRAISESWLRAQGIAQNRHEILRLRLGLKESRLQRLPWEVLQQDGQPLTTRTDVTFTRYAASLLDGQAATIDRPEVGQAIHVLLVVASPNDQEHLKLTQEVGYVRELLAAVNGKTPPIQIDVLEQPDRGLLAQKLEQGNYQVLHYAGHSDFGQNGGDLFLVNRQSGLTERLSGDDLAGLLVNNHVALAVFNSCRSGHTAGDDVEMDWCQQNFVQALVNRGVPSVIAMAEEIPDEVAIAFTRLFYHNLRTGFPVDVSLSRTRQGLIAAFGSDRHYWALPILHLQPEFDGYLTRRDEAAQFALDPDAIAHDDTAALDFVPVTATDNVPPAISAAETPVNDSPPLPEAPEAAVEPEPDELPTTAPPPDLSDLESVTTTLLSQLGDAAGAEPDDDELLVSYVQQLSKNSAIADDPPMVADEAEVLMNEDSQRAGMEIYDTLPEVSLQLPERTAAKSTSPVPQPVATPDTHAQTATPQSLYAPRKKSLAGRRKPEKPLLVWFALGLVGVVGVIGLSFLAMRWAGQFPDGGMTAEDVTPPSGAPTAASPDPNTLIRRAEDAIAQKRFDDAREDFELALTQATIGNADYSTISDSIWPWVADARTPEMAYVKGRIAWQEIAQITSEVADFDSRYNSRTFAQQAQEAWDLTDDTFLEGRIARGFAHYYNGDYPGAIKNWEAALNLYDEQRQRLPNPASSTPADPVITHAYAGLVMAYTKLGNINLAGLSEDEGLSNASDPERALLENESAVDLSYARENFLRLQDIDEFDRMGPNSLQQMTTAPETWNNWWWTDELLNDWRRAYRYWDAETSSAVSREEVEAESE